MRTHVVASLLAATALVAAVPAHADRVVPVDIHLTGKIGPLPDRVDCTTTPGVCELYFHGALVDDGAWTGTGQVQVHGHFVSSGGFVFRLADHEVVTGPCGSGAIDFTADGDISALDPGATSLVGHDDWRVISGSGTGDLADLTAGSGVDDFLLSPVSGAMQVHTVGWVRC